MNILLVGKTGSGKSSLGNALLRGETGQGARSDAFCVNHSMCSSSVECKVAKAAVRGRQLTVVDTPGTMDTSSSLEEALHEVARAIVHCPSGFHVVLILIRIDCRFTNEERAAVELVTHMFGDDFYMHCILVFTYGESIDSSEATFARHIYEIRSANKFLNSLLNRCGNRHVLVDNTRNTKPLFDQMDSLIRQNGGATFTNRYFKLAQEELRLQRTALQSEEQRRQEEFNRLVKEAGKAERAKLERQLQQDLEQIEKRAVEGVTVKVHNSADANGDTCFPGDATVITPMGPVQMRDLRLGQLVLGRSCSGNGRLVFSPVYAWGHRDPDAADSAWLSVQTGCGRNITLSPGHLLLLAETVEKTGQTSTAAANHLHPGQSTLWSLGPDGLQSDLVVHIQQPSKSHRGVYALFTMCGSLLVDGVLASCYVDCSPLTASNMHALLAPMRAAWRAWPAGVEAAGCPQPGNGALPGWVRLATKVLLALPSPTEQE